MIEEIKKEISNLTTFNGGHNRMYISDLFKILDKYKEKESSQLQVYKQKEDKLKEYLTNTEFEERTAYDASFCEGVYNTKEKALRILNEGDK